MQERVEPTVIPFEDLRRSPTAALFEGGEQAAVSCFITTYEHGQGPDLHFHPYAEVFVVETGTATFHVDGAEHEVGAGHVVVVPPRAVHGFKNRGSDTLHVLGIHPSPHVQQTDVE
jgi:mannose-6-phosphate isomerase-like protein (cupin superfamily)